MSTLLNRVQRKIDNKAKPPGSLGMLESIAHKVAMVQGTEHPVIQNPTIVVFAGDHGIATKGLVNPYPQSITALMVRNFSQGGAAINSFCKSNQITLVVVDAGVNADLSNLKSSSLFIDAKIGFGTACYLEAPAMSLLEVNQAIKTGQQITASIIKSGCNLIGFGEMGISNSSSAALIMNAVTEIPLDECVGKGTGSSEEQLAIKKTILTQVAAMHREALQSKDAYQILSAVGGFEIAMMTGAYLEAYDRKATIVVDGFISTAALLLAHAINPAILESCIFAHCSGEKGHGKMLNYLDQQALLNLGMRLGEGTGAALAMPLIKSAVIMLNEMASLEDVMALGA